MGQLVNPAAGLKQMDSIIERNKEFEKMGVPAFIGFIAGERAKIAQDLAALN